jgi:hypothetical protein
MGQNESTGELAWVEISYIRNPAREPGPNALSVITNNTRNRRRPDPRMAAANRRRRRRFAAYIGGPDRMIAIEAMITTLKNALENSEIVDDQCSMVIYLPHGAETEWIQDLEYDNGQLFEYWNDIPQNILSGLTCLGVTQVYDGERSDTDFRFVNIFDYLGVSFIPRLTGHIPHWEQGQENITLEDITDV